MKLIIKVLLMLSLILLMGCTTPAENNATPTPTDMKYTSEDLFASTNIQETITLPEKDTDGTSSKETSDLPEYLKPQKNIEYVKYDAANRFRSPDGEVDLNSLFCMDPDTGVAYFINQNKDWYIYRIVDGKTEPVVELPARELYVRNGKIYFILEDYNRYKLEGLTEGAVYSYTLIDDGLNMVVSAEGLESEIYRIRPYEDGLALCCRTKEKVSDARWQIDYFYYYYNFADGTLETDSYMRVWPGWENYYQTWNKVDGYSVTSLWSRTEQEKEQLNYDFNGYRSFIVEDIMYWFTGSQVCVTNLSLDEQKVFDINALFREAVPKYAAMWEEDGIGENVYLLESFTVTKDAVWLSIMHSYVARLDTTTGDMDCFQVDGLNGRVCNLYTDGINLYGTYADTTVLWNIPGTPVRICTEKIVKPASESLYGMPVIAVEYLTD